MKNEKEKDFRIKKGTLITATNSKKREKKLQLCVPLDFRNQIFKLCPEEIAGHLGVTKTKDKVSDYYFWPNCYQEIEELVRTSDTCQRVGHGDKRKALMKLVPVISEVYRRLNIDAV